MIPASLSRGRFFLLYVCQIRLMNSNPFATNIETYHLTDEQRLGLDPIRHTGRGIPFYILIDKDGIIVDFGEHLRPSIPETRDIIDKHLQGR
jgi:hypothetical protein